MPSLKPNWKPSSMISSKLGSRLDQSVNKYVEFNTDHWQTFQYQSQLQVHRKLHYFGGWGKWNGHRWSLLLGPGNGWFGDGEVGKQISHLYRECLRNCRMIDLHRIIILISKLGNCILFSQHLLLMSFL